MDRIDTGATGNLTNKVRIFREALTPMYFRVKKYTPKVFYGWKIF